MPPPNRWIIIRRAFPPVAGVLEQRTFSLARNLQECEYGLHVLTAWNPGASVMDSGLLHLILDPAERLRCILCIVATRASRDDGLRPPCLNIHVYQWPRLTAVLPGLVDRTQPSRDDRGNS